MELERKMEDFHRREHEYKKEIVHYKNALSKMTVDRNQFKENYEVTSGILEEKLKVIEGLEGTL